MRIRKTAIAAALMLGSLAVSGCYGDRYGRPGSAGRHDRHDRDDHHRGGDRDHHRGDRDWRGHS